MMLGTATVIRGDARSLPLADNTVDLVVTSPPYFALRSYQDGGDHYAGQLGSEATPAEFVAALLDVTRECMRVLKPSGSLFVNLGDKYAGSRMDGGSGWASAPLDHDQNKHQLTKLAASQGTLRTSTTIPTKSLIGIPWRYALACIDNLGLILRAEVIWSKPNGLPESVTDRVRRSHEQWFHFTLSPRYFSAVDEIREPHNSVTWLGRDKQERSNSDRNDGGKMANTANPLGKLPGSVWTIPTEPLTVPDHLGVDHFAAFPTAWPKRITQGWSPAGVCVECGEGRRPVSRVERDGDCSPRRASDRGFGVAQGDNRHAGVVTITGYVCACPHPTAATTPAVVLDPFGGTGTTAMVAKALGRHGISIDMSADYCRLATWRTTDRNQLANILDIPRIPPPPDTQPTLFDTPQYGVHPRPVDTPGIRAISNHQPHHQVGAELGAEVGAELGADPRH